MKSLGKGFALFLIFSLCLTAFAQDKNEQTKKLIEQIWGSPETIAQKAESDQVGEKRFLPSLETNIAMNAISFGIVAAERDENGLPLNGSTFVVTGYIYPAGTFDENGNDSGVLENGDPQFPDRVIGTWYCRGWVIQDGASITVQTYDFNDDAPGFEVLNSEGYEQAGTYPRAIIGGTGKYKYTRGQVMQMGVANNATFGVNFVHQFQIPPEHWLKSGN